MLRSLARSRMAFIVNLNHRNEASFLEAMVPMRAVCDISASFKPRLGNALRNVDRISNSFTKQASRSMTRIS